MSEFATVLELQKIKAEIKKLLTPLNKLKIDPEEIQKYIKQEMERKVEEKRKKEIDDYKFTESEYETFLEGCLDTSFVQDVLDISPNTQVYHYDYSNFLAENHRDKVEEIMKILIDTHDKIGLILLSLVHVEEKKKKMGSFSTRRAKYNLENVV